VVSAITQVAAHERRDQVRKGAIKRAKKRFLSYESSALPLSYSGNGGGKLANLGGESNQNFFTSFRAPGAP
jgi:hypothetical protein